jgi:hypothetical protein
MQQVFGIRKLRAYAEPDTLPVFDTLFGAATSEFKPEPGDPSAVMHRPNGGGNLLVMAILLLRWKAAFYRTSFRHL